MLFATTRLSVPGSQSAYDDVRRGDQITYGIVNSEEALSRSVVASYELQRLSFSTHKLAASPGLRPSLLL